AGLSLVVCGVIGASLLVNEFMTSKGGVVSVSVVANNQLGNDVSSRQGQDMQDMQDMQDILGIGVQVRLYPLALNLVSVQNLVLAATL
ncbi:MAG: hypothetical protein JKX72_00510, partial [Robiginitomaculum sp.]|nr:hypothetical protein [Robiginitomaculum sp.]